MVERNEEYEQVQRKGQDGIQVWYSQGTGKEREVGRLESRRGKGIDSLSAN